MGRRRAKQVIYGVFYLIVFGAIVWAFSVLFLRPAPSCTNGRQDRGEEGVDCGGVCANICLPGTLRPLRVTKVTVFHPLPNRVSILAQIQNPNPGLAAERFDYTVTLSGAAGKTERSGTSFIYRGEVKYLAVFLEMPEGNAGGSAALVVRNPRWVRGETFLRPKIAVQDRKSEGDERQIAISGRLANNDTVTLPAVTVLAIFKDSAGKQVGVSETEVAALAPGERRQFTVIHPALRGADLPKTDLVLYGERP